MQKAEKLIQTQLIIAFGSLATYNCCEKYFESYF